MDQPVGDIETIGQEDVQDVGLEDNENIEDAVDVEHVEDEIPFDENQIIESDEAEAETWCKT